jgi:predicted SnoaL-like aldol condensation-catalyzing enzyme
VSAKGDLDAVARGIVDDNPLAPDGPEAFVAFVKAFPELSADIRTVIAEGDLVVTHGVVKFSAEDRGTVAVDIFRLDDGEVVEHWDVVQPWPEECANRHPMFQRRFARAAVPGAYSALDAQEGSGLDGEDVADRGHRRVGRGRREPSGRPARPRPGAGRPAGDFRRCPRRAHRG